MGSQESFHQVRVSAKTQTKNNKPPTFPPTAVLRVKRYFNRSGPSEARSYKVRFKKEGVEKQINLIHGDMKARRMF